MTSLICTPQGGTRFYRASHSAQQLPLVDLGPCAGMTAGGSDTHTLPSTPDSPPSFYTQTNTEEGGRGMGGKQYPRFSTGSWNKGDPVRNMARARQVVKRKKRRIGVYSDMKRRLKPQATTLRFPSTNAFSLSHSRSLSLGMLSVVNSITTRAIAYTILHRSLVYW